MTLSTLAIRNRKSVMFYFGLTLFSIAFSFIYESFSHGVYSNYMIYLFAFPLILGVVGFLFISNLPDRLQPSRIHFNLYNSAIVCLMLGSLLQGILEIYGTSSGWTLFYPIIGFTLLISTIVFYLQDIK